MRWSSRDEPSGEHGWCVMSWRAWALVAMTVACATFAPRSVRADALSAVFSKVKPSVVYIVCAVNDGVSSGSGFVVSSGETTSSIVTANHVVDGASKIDVMFDGDTKHRYQATILKRDRTRDIVELSVPLGHRSALRLEDGAQIHEGMSIAAVGYPRAVKRFEELMGDSLRPSVHAGIVSAIRLSGEVVQFDAETDYGDSGGPVIDAGSGLVVGVVRGNLIGRSALGASLETLPGSTFAVSSSSLTAMLSDTSRTASSGTAHVRSAGASTAWQQAGAAGTASSAAYRVGFATPHYDDPNVDAAAIRLSARLADHFSNGNEIYVVPTAPGIAELPKPRLASYCDDMRLNALVTPHVRLSAAEVRPDGLNGHYVRVTVDLSVTDCSGKVYFFDEKTTGQAIAFAGRSQDRDIVDLCDGMLDGLVRAFERFREVHGRMWTSLLKTGLALDPESGRYHSLIGVDRNKDSKDWRITTVYPDGPAAVAGIRPGDTIVAVDGTPTRGLSKDALESMLDMPAYTMSVLRPGGLAVLAVRARKYADLTATLTR